MNFTTKFCKNCEFNDAKTDRCSHTKSIRYVNPINGNTMYESNVFMRANENMCGYDALLFKQAEKPLNFWQKYIRNTK